MLSSVAKAWRAWLPPILFAFVVFAGAVLLSGNGQVVSLVYRVF